MNFFSDYSVNSFQYLGRLQPYWIDLFKQSFVLVLPKNAISLDSLSLQKLNDLIQNPDHAEHFSERFPSDLVSYYSAIGWLFSGDIGRAHKCLQDFSVHNPFDPAYFFVNMFICLLAEKYEDGVNSIEEAVVLSPDFSLFHAFRAYLQCFCRNYHAVLHSAPMAIASDDAILQKLQFFRYLPFCLYQAETMLGRESSVLFDNTLLDNQVDADSHLKGLSDYLPDVCIYKMPDIKRKHCVMVMADSVYFKKWAIAMLMSFNDYFSEATFHVHIANPDQECYFFLDKLNVALDNNLIVTSEVVDFSKYCLSSAYFVAVRFCRLYQFSKLITGFDSYSIVDADLIVNNSLDKLFDFSEKAVSLVYFKDEPLWDSLMGGLCIFGKSRLDDLLLWISHFIFKTVCSGNAAWFLDIVAIAQSVLKFEKNGLSSVVLHEPALFLDLAHRRESYIWAVTNDKDAFLYGAKNEFYFRQFLEKSAIEQQAWKPELLKSMDPYWIQPLTVDKRFLNVDRNSFYASLCHSKKVLHIGCADYPITNIDSNLHIHLDKCCDIDGCDTQAEALELLRPYVKGKLLTDLNDAKDYYDLVLIPEVIEHVDNLADFLALVNNVDFRYLVLTVPDAYLCSKTHFYDQSEGEGFVELNHPDHNYWFSPYTIQNVIRKYTDWNILKLAYFDQRSIMLIAEKKNFS